MVSLLCHKDLLRDVAEKRPQPKVVIRTATSFSIIAESAVACVQKSARILAVAGKQQSDDDRDAFEGSAARLTRANARPARRGCALRCDDAPRRIDPPDRRG